MTRRWAIYFDVAAGDHRPIEVKVERVPVRAAVMT